MKPENFAKNLKHIMKTIGITQSELAKLAGITNSCLCQVMNGDRDPRLSTIIKIMKVIPVKFDVLVRGNINEIEVNYESGEGDKVNPILPNIGTSQHLR
jgi:predicted transcriptional regulator